MQSAYRILVAGNEGDLEAEENLLWDSGRVESGRTIGVEYEGEALRSGSQCVEGACLGRGRRPLALQPSGRLRDGPAGEVGLGGNLDLRRQRPGRRHGAAIGGRVRRPGQRTRPEPLPAQGVSHWTNRSAGQAMYATARGVYELYINGTRVGNDVLAPGWTDYDRRIQYQTYDVTPLLAEGPNALGAVLGDGWFAGFCRVRPQTQGRPLRSPPAASRAARRRVRGRHDREPRDRRLVEMLDRPDPLLRPPHGRVLRRP